MLYDMILVCGVIFVFFTAAYLPLALMFDMEPTRGHWLWTLYIIVVGVGFHLYFWTHGGQTLGMKTWKTRLVSTEGGKVSLQQALIRYAVALVSLAALGIGYGWSLFDAEKRTWHDIASHTKLVIVP